MKKKAMKTTIRTTAKTTNILALMCLMIILTGILTACSTTQKQGTETEKEIAPPEASAEQATAEIIEKRGQKTNITEFEEFLRRSSAIESYKYTLSDSETEEEWTYFILGRFVKVKLNILKRDSAGNEYSEVFLDRITKTAFTHCGREYCDKDREIEKTEYEEYYQPDPNEMITGTRNAEYLTEEMLGNDATKVFSITHLGEPSKVWVQEYYGYPLKFKIGDRTIEYKEMTIDATRRGEIDLPFNFTVKGEKGNWYFWEHYLGLWPEKKNELVTNAGAGA